MGSAYTGTTSSLDGSGTSITDETDILLSEKISDERYSLVLGGNEQVVLPSGYYDKDVVVATGENTMTVVTKIVNPPYTLGYQRGNFYGQDGNTDTKYTATLTCPLCGEVFKATSSWNYAGGSHGQALSYAKSNYFDHLVATHTE